MSPSIELWLSEAQNANSCQSYRHRHLLEAQVADRNHLMPQLKHYITRAHADASKRFQSLFRINLDPLAGEVKPNTINYPGSLPDSTLMGYFGEVMAGFLAEHVAPFGMDWHTPVFLFRFHEDANQYLHRLRQLVEEGSDLTTITQRAVSGRHGDDSVSFTRDDSGRITAVLVCEAKCIKTSNTQVIKDAYGKISRDGLRPDCLYQLIQILEDYTDEQSIAWKDAFRDLQHSSQTVLQQFKRYHAITYICGHIPQRTGQTCWLPKEQPHEAYISTIPLEAIEVCITGIQELVIELYRN